MELYRYGLFSGNYFKTTVLGVFTISLQPIFILMILKSNNFISQYKYNLNSCWYEKDAFHIFDHFFYFSIRIKRLSMSRLRLTACFSDKIFPAKLVLIFLILTLKIRLEEKVLCREALRCRKCINWVRIVVAFFSAPLSVNSITKIHTFNTSWSMKLLFVDRSANEHLFWGKNLTANNN